MRQLHILFDSAWTEPLPIYAWAIETDDGVIVVDTGETAKTGEPGYFPSWHPYFRLAVRVNVSPEQEIGPRLLEIGIRPDDVRTVILTHLHTDHAGGLHHASSTPRMRQNPVYKNIDPIIRKIDREETSSRITQLRHLANASRNQLLANGRADLLCRVDNCSSLPGIQPGHIEQLANELETAVHGFRNARDLRRMGLWS
jgi:hypothetical protein